MHTSSANSSTCSANGSERWQLRHWLAKLISNDWHKMYSVRAAVEVRRDSRLVQDP